MILFWVWIVLNRFATRPSDDPITRIGLSTTALEGRDESEDELCWGQP